MYVKYEGCTCFMRACVFVGQGVCVCVCGWGYNARLSSTHKLISAAKLREVSVRSAAEPIWSAAGKRLETHTR